MSMYPSRAHGVHGQGTRAFNPEERARVLDYVRNHAGGPEESITVEELSTAVEVAGRTVRAILHSIDGVDLLLGQNDLGIYVCRNRADAYNRTARIRSQGTVMLAHADRRDAFAMTLPANGEAE